MAQQRVGLGLAATELAEHLCRVHTAAEGEDSVAEAPPDATHLHAPGDAGAPRSIPWWAGLLLRITHRLVVVESRLLERRERVR